MHNPHTHSHIQTVYSPDYKAVCAGVISESPTTPQRLSLISHEWLGCCDVCNSGRCETGCETVVISYVIALWRLGGLNHARHSPLAANHATNGKWNIRLPLITMASQGQDLTQIANTNKQCHSSFSEDFFLKSSPLFCINPKQRLDACLSADIWIWHLMAD